MKTSQLALMFEIPDNDSRRTFQEDENLPNLPLPDLRHTLMRYLESVVPFVTSEEYVRTKRLVAEFEEGVGQILHEKLKEKAKTERNWVEKWWEDVAYLETRQPLLLSSSMTSVLPKNFIHWTYGTQNDQIKHASIFCYYLVKFWDLIRNELLLPNQAGDKKTNFSMTQYKKLYNTVRIPGDKKDILTSFFKTGREGQCSSNVIVLCKGRIFSVNALDEKGKISSPLFWEEVFEQIIKVCDEIGEGSGVGMLSCDMRSNWSKNRRHLIEISEKNAIMMDLIERSLFVLILEDDVPETDSNLLNKNICGNYRNRWADKSMCILFYKNGRGGTISDHTAFDGIVALSCLHYVMTAIAECKGEWSKQPTADLKQIVRFEEIEFDVDDELRREMKRVEMETSKYGEDVDMSMRSFDDYGKLEIQRLKCHPDTFIQMCLQLAYVRLHGKPASCYETATTRKFYNGRTETVRSCTVECLEWVSSMLDEKSTNDERKTLMGRAVKRHYELMKEAREGRGCDRHLFGLYCLAMESGIEVPQLFSDPSYFKSCTGYTPLGGGVTPMCPNGYGVFYNILPNRCVNFTLYLARLGPINETNCNLLSSIYFMLSVNKKNDETNGDKYYESITASFRQMREMLMASTNSSKL
ncbi:hypothetical protein RUM43_014374 [Polyplax serrata]|uniref:Choline/carnitine acyltransferase domain-containing protein n=1 Tax=Polyplax serrata TaxID=468196 RepID=A0AAN8P4R1_POLSC